VHFNDLLNDLRGTVRHLSDFLSLSVDEHRLTTVTDSATFAHMRAAADILIPEAKRIFRGGAATFFHKGTNGRWRDVLNDVDLELYSRAAERELSPVCRKWLERSPS